MSETSLTRETAFQMEASGLPNTFVPGRNLLFLTLAAALAYRRDLQVIVTGVCETDFSGYLGNRTHCHAWGYGCGECPACELRARGFVGYSKNAR